MPVSEEMLTLLDTINVTFTQPWVKKFLRASIGEELYTSRSYTRMEKRNCYTVLFQDQAGGTHLGVIEYFILLANHGYALVSILAPLQRNPLPPFVGHLCAVAPQRKYSICLSGTELKIKGLAI